MTNEQKLNVHGIRGSVTFCLLQLPHSHTSCTQYHNQANVCKQACYKLLVVVNTILHAVYCVPKSDVLHVCDLMQLLVCTHLRKGQATSSGTTCQQTETTVPCATSDLLLIKCVKFTQCTLFLCSLALRQCWH